MNIIKIGTRVFHRFRQNFTTLEYYHHGTIVDIEQGCNGGIIVKWDNHGYEISMVASDLGIIINGTHYKLELDNGVITATD